MSEPSPAAEAAAEAAAQAVHETESTEAAQEAAAEAAAQSAEATAHAQEASAVAGDAHATASHAAESAAEAGATADATADAVIETANVTEASHSELRGMYDGLHSRIEALERHRDSQAQPEPEVVSVPVTDTPESKPAEKSSGESNLDRKRRHKFGR